MGGRGCFGGNLVDVIRVAPSKAIELFAYDPPKLSIPLSLIAGACAGVSSTLCMYLLEFPETRLTTERGVYDNIMHAFVKILREEGPTELYRVLTPSPNRNRTLGRH